MKWKEGAQLRNHLDDNWEFLKSIEPGASKKSAIRIRILSSIRSKQAPKRHLDFKYILLTSLFLIISAGALLQLQNTQQNTGSPITKNGTAMDFTWDLKKVYSDKTGDRFAFFKEGSSIQVGYAEDVSNQKKTEIFSNKAVHIEKELEHFPYPTTLYIEHVKMQDVALRYHFLVTTGDHTTHFSFDYPKLEYAEIFQLIASLKNEYEVPYRHGEQLFVTHGYDTLPYPVGLDPVKNFGENTEKYIWEKASKIEYRNYLDKIRSTGEWTEKQGEGSSHTFESVTGYVIVKITLNGKEITYDYSYPKQEE
jgi:hypothetical protein